MKNLIVVCIVTLFAVSPASAQLELPEIELPGMETEAFTEEELIPVSKKPIDVKYSMPHDMDSVFCFFSLKNPAKLNVILTDVSGKDFKFSFDSASQEFLTKKAKKERTIVGIKEAIPVFKNQAIYIKELGITYFIRPLFKRYNDDEVNRKMFEWECLPDALNHRAKLDFRTVSGSVRIYIDGRYAASFVTEKGLSMIKFSGGSGSEISNPFFYRNNPGFDSFETIDLAPVANSGSMKLGTLSLPPGKQTVLGIPFVVEEGRHSSDIALTKVTRGLDRALMDVDYNLSRDAFERLPESQVISVPLAYYNKVFLLFALDPDPSKKRAMTLRLTRFCGGNDGRGAPHAHTDIVLPEKDSDFPPNIRKVGEVRLNGQTLPLYFGEFPMDIGELLDIIDNDPHPRPRNLKYPYLDFEVFGSRWKDSLKPDGSLSAFNLFGITLKRSPLELHMKQLQPGNIFTADEIPETVAQVRAVADGDYSLEWTIDTIEGKNFYRDRFDWISVSGKPALKREVREFSLKKGEEKELRIPLSMPQTGHYIMRLTVSEKSSGKPLFDHRAAFALLPKDDRRATPEESPYITWWTFQHHGTQNTDVALSICKKAGIRRVPAGNAKPVGGPLTAADATRYKITLAQYPWNGKFDPDKKEEAEAYLNEKIAPLVKMFPETKAALIFHESYGDSLPPELIGETYEATEEQLARDRSFVKIATVAAEYYRKYFPDVKLIYGNNTSSSAIIAALLRNGFDVKLMDFIGLETPGQGCLPERLFLGGTQGAWFVRETARLFGHDIPLTGCFEYTARPRRLLGYQRQAEYYIRDALLGFAYGFRHIRLCNLAAPTDSFIQTLWGDGGLCERGPNFYPKPVYVAYAALTRTLDQAEFKRKINTSSNTVYVHEYERKRGDYVYPFWLPRGEAELEFVFEDDEDVIFVDFYGRERKINPHEKRLMLCAGTAPGYLISGKKLLSARVVRRVVPPAPSHAVIVDAMEDVSRWNLLSESKSLPEKWDIFRKEGKFEMTNAVDDEKGKTMELRLIKNHSLPDLFLEYAKIELKTPLALPGSPDEIGIWAKGDSGWGKIGFEIRDAKGRLWRTEGMWHDFSCELYLNFDGWRFLSFPLPGEGKEAPVNPSNSRFWNPVDPKTRGSISYPVELTALYITLSRKALDPTDMKEVPGVVRLKDLCIME